MECCVNVLKDRRIRFLIVGGVNTVVGYFLFVSIYLAFGSLIHYSLIVLLAHSVSVVISFLMHKAFVFRYTGAVLKAFIRFNISATISLFSGLFGMVWCVEVWRLSPLFAQAVVTVCSVCISFVLHRGFSFRSAD